MIDINWFMDKDGCLKKDDLFKYLEKNIKYASSYFFENPNIESVLKIEFFNLNYKKFANHILNKFDIKNIDELLLLIKNIDFVTIASLCTYNKFDHVISSDTNEKKIELLKYIESAYLKQKSPDDTILSIPKLDINELGIDLDLGFYLSFNPYVEMNYKNIEYLKTNNQVYTKVLSGVNFSKFESEELMIDFVNYHLNTNKYQELIMMMDLLYHIDRRLYEYVFINHFDKIKTDIEQYSPRLSDFILSNIHNQSIIDKFNSLNIGEKTFKYPIYQLTTLISKKPISDEFVSDFIEQKLVNLDPLKIMDIKNLILSLLSDENKKSFIHYLYFINDLIDIPPHHPFALSISKILGIENFDLKEIENNIFKKSDQERLKEIFELLKLKSFMDFNKMNQNNIVEYNSLQLE